MDEKRKAARWRKRRIVYNNDGQDVIEARTGVEHHHDIKWQMLVRSGGELIDDFLNARSAPLVGTQVDSNLYCTCRGGLAYSHHTKLGGYYGKGVAQELIDTYGRDSLQIQVDFSHEHGMEVFWSLRMNDDHDSYPMGYRHQHDHALALFKREHPEYLMGEPADWEKYPEGPRHTWSSLDFSYPEVREHVFSLIREVAQNYDVDGVELDFFRSPPYFAPTRDGLPVEEQHLAAMTDLVRRLRSMADDVGQQRGRPLLLAARTPFTVEDARFIGLDLEGWLAEDLIDILIPGGGTESTMTESFKEIVDLGHKYEVPVYPCIDWAGFWSHWAFLDLGAREHRTYESWLKTLYGGHPKDIEKLNWIVAFNSWEGAAATWRGAAMNLWNAGADGIYIFNGFHSTDINRWREIGDPETMANKDKIFGVERFTGDSSFKNVRELELKQGEPVSLHFQVGEDVESGNAAELRFRLHLWDLAENDDVAVTLNDGLLDNLTPAGSNQSTTGAQWLECLLHSTQVKRGENRVELMVKKRDEPMQRPPVLDAVQLRVHYKG
jgi:hypothetical protein